MIEVVERLVGWIALAVEVSAALLIGFGAAEALVRTIALGGRANLAQKKLVWMHFARWLLLGLEFQLAADVVRTAISPTWDEVGQLGAIAVIRTFLAYFLSRDIREVAELGGPGERVERSA